MPRTSKKVVTKKRRPPARTPEEQEKRMISMAMDLAEKQLSEGTATSQVMTHFLKLGTSLAVLEKEKLEKENELLAAKAESLQSQKRVEELYAQAIKAMQIYSGSITDRDED